MTASRKQLAEQLLASKIITQDQYQGILQVHKMRGGFIEEVILETGALSEGELLKALAQMYRTRFVTTDKLRMAAIPGIVLEKVSLEIAAKYLVFPILYDEATNQLSIVAVDPTNIKVEEEIARQSRVARVRSFVGRPDAIKSAIAKFYKGDIHAFDMVDKETIAAYANVMDVYERNLLDEADMASAVAGSGRAGERMISAEQIDDTHASTSPGESQKLGASHLGATVEMMRVMVSLLESKRTDLAGHSVLAAHHAERMCRQMDLSEKETHEITLAALLHDLGKGSPYHLTPFNVSEWDGHQTAATKRLENPTRLFESVDLPESTVKAIHYMYEKFDGSGIPDGLRGNDIPLGARILALADTYVDLTSNPRNPFRRSLSLEEAVNELKRRAGTLFDSNLVEIFAKAAAGDDITRQLLTGAKSVLIVDSDPEQCAILDLQLTTRGFKVATARTADTAIRTVFETPPDLILSEVDLQPFDGFEMKKRLNDNDNAARVPFLYFSSRASSDDVQKGFSLGAKDFVVKPSTIDVVVAKMKQYLDQAGSQASGGVSGSLTEMNLTDLVQILSHGRKSGCLSLSVQGTKGEIHFVSGDIYNALYGELRGEEAFFAMLRAKDGNFHLNADYVADGRAIEMSAEMLLLEGLRRYDEDGR